MINTHLVIMLSILQIFGIFVTKNGQIIIIIVIDGKLFNQMGIFIVNEWIFLISLSDHGEYFHKYDLYYSETI